MHSDTRRRREIYWTSLRCCRLPARGARTASEGLAHQACWKLLREAANVANLDAFFGNSFVNWVTMRGRTLSIEYRFPSGDIDRFPELAAELMRLNVDVIVTRGTPAVLAARNITATIPIVMAASARPR